MFQTNHSPFPLFPDTEAGKEAVQDLLDVHRPHQHVERVSGGSHVMCGEHRVAPGLEVRPNLGQCLASTGQRLTVAAAGECRLEIGQWQPGSEEPLTRLAP